MGGIREKRNKLLLSSFRVLSHTTKSREIEKLLETHWRYPSARYLKKQELEGEILGYLIDAKGM